MDRPGKDTYRHREAGAHEVLVAAGTRWVLLHEVVGAEPSLPELLERDAEGLSGAGRGLQDPSLPKLEVHRPVLGKPPIWPDHADIVAVASDVPVSTDRKLLPLNDPRVISEWILNG